MKNTNEYKNSFRILKGGKISLVVSSFLASTTLTFAAPSGGVVTSGSANISQTGKVTDITQSSNKASINWNKFNIANDEIVNFKQPNVNSITLNRVIGNEKSIINGALNANGQVWILNSNGVLFGKNAKVNTAGLIATTKELSDTDFQAGNYNFKGNSSESVINMGEIDISDSGYATLLANTVSNEGTIKAVKGSVRLLGANEVTVNLNGNSIIDLTVNKGVLDALVENKGAVYADGGEIYLTTNAVDELLKGVVNNTGIIEANSLDGITGHVELFAHGGEVQVGGAISAKDGFIETSGKDFKILENATVKAGEWLIDPVDVTIDETLASTIVTALGSGDVTIKTDSPNTSTNVTVPAENQTSTDTDTTNGDIYVNSDITWSTDKKLTLNATDAIYVNAIIQNTNATNGGVYFEAANTTDKVIFDANGKVIVNNVNQLQWMNTALNGKYELGSNIDASATSGWNAGKGWNPIGDGTNNFKGKFDGTNKTISNLKINDSTIDNVGLFGYADGATISNLGLVDVDIKGRYNVGGLVGFNYVSSITNSYASGTVSGEYYVGGLVGNNYALSSITNSYASGTVSGTDKIGGLIGSNSNSSITNSYASGTVSGDSNVGGLVGNNYDSSIADSYASGTVSGDSNAGGLVGSNSSGTITNSFYDNESNTASMDDSANGRTKAQILTVFSNKTGWTTTGGGGAAVEGYELLLLPYLTNVTRDEDKSTFILFESGMGTSSNAYKISNWNQLQNINYNTSILGKNFILSNNLTSTTAGYTNQVKAGANLANGAKGWNPIGNNTNRFTGNFDGDGKIISNLFINRTSQDYIGLFGYTDSATIKNLGVVDVDIKGKNNTGGLIGDNDSSTITNSYVVGTVSGNDIVGGLVGANASSTITNSYASGTVSGYETVGGLVGFNFSTITNSYANGAVSGTDRVGGLIGFNYAGTTTNSFYNKTNNPTTATISGVTGLSTKEFSYGQIFKTASWDIVADSTVASSTPIIKYDSANSKYVWAIAPLDLSYTLSDKSKTYDGQTQSLSSLYTNVFGSDYSFINGYKFQVSSSDVTGYRNAETYDGIKVVSTNDFLTIKTTGNTDGKYIITKKDITSIIGITAENKIYDGTTDATLKTTNAIFAGMIANDKLNVATSKGTFDNKNASTGKTVSITDLALGGEDANNYNLTSTTATTTAEINKKDITSIIGITAENKTYDGITDATLVTTNAAFEGMITNDKLNIANSIGVFDNKNVGTKKTVNISNLALGGEDVNNYNLTSTTATTTAEITKKALAISGITAENKTYDGNTDAVVNDENVVKTGLVDGDILTLATSGIFIDKNAGKNKTVNLTTTYAGTDKDNYNITDQATTTAEINKKALAISGITAENKIYDGTTDATLKTTNAIFAGMIANDKLNVATSKGTFDNKNASTGKTVSITDLALGGEDANNYNLTSTTATTTAEINKKDITSIIGITAENKTYDGITDATLVTTNAAFEGMITNDKLNVANSIGVFDNKNVGTKKTVNISNLALGGDDSNNYNLTSTTASTTADIILASTPQEKIIRAAENSIRSLDAPLLLTNIPFERNSNIRVVAQPSNIQTSQSVSLGKLQQSQIEQTDFQTTADIRVPVSTNSQIILVNAGVSLPLGVEQEFYVSNTNTQESK